MFIGEPIHLDFNLHLGIILSLTKMFSLAGVCLALLDFLNEKSDVFQGGLFVLVDCFCDLRFDAEWLKRFDSSECLTTLAQMRELLVFRLGFLVFYQVSTIFVLATDIAVVALNNRLSGMARLVATPDYAQSRDENADNNSSAAHTRIPSCRRFVLGGRNT